MWKWAAHYSPDLAEMTGFPGVRTATIEQAFSRVHRDDVAKFRQQYLEAQSPAGSGQINIEICETKPGGETRWMTWSGRAVYRDTPTGRVPSKFFGACVDITERKRTEQALLESEQRFKNMANTAPAILWRRNPTDRAPLFRAAGMSSLERRTPECRAWNGLHSCTPMTASAASVCSAKVSRGKSPSMSTIACGVLTASTVG